MTLVRAPSRLHFGLLSLPSPDGVGRHFGGAGLMLREPGLRVRVERANTWTASGPLGKRALGYARQLAPDMPCAVHVEQAPPDHVGLGTGTQLALAVGAALSLERGHPVDVESLARRLSRGQRSGIGVHGFARGGFLVDGGKGPGTVLAPLLARQDFPDEWKILLAVPRRHQGLHGSAEKAAFAQSCNQESRTEQLCRLLLLGVLPGLAERDLRVFGGALTEFNRKVGEMFAPWQGGPYAGAWTSGVVEFLLKEGFAAGQSSWGPTAFGIGEENQIKGMAERLKKSLSDGEVRVVAACNCGASWDPPLAA